MEKEMVEIDKEILEELRDDHELLECLRSAGVDNWEGWDYAIEMYHEYLEKKTCR